ncbi:MAG: S1C family serine protease [Nitrososphaerales archaeon]
MMDEVLKLDADSANVVDEVYKSLVQVRNGKRGAGAGTIWHPQGLIVTNAHVAGRGPLKVELIDGRVFDAEILSVDRDCDLAALRIQAEGLPTAQLADSRAVRPGQWVMALGHPWGVTGAATGGVIIGMGRQWPEMPSTRQDWLVVSLHMRPGHSGGPLVDVRGRLLGINTMINGPDVGFAIPSHVVVEFLKRTLLK